MTGASSTVDSRRVGDRESGSSKIASRVWICAFDYYQPRLSPVVLFFCPPLTGYCLCPSPGRRSGIWRGWILHTEPELLPGFFPLPDHHDALVQRMQHFDGPRSIALLHAAAATPAFIGVEYDRRLPLFRIRHQHVVSTYLCTPVTSVANIRIEINRSVRRRLIGYHVNFVSHDSLPPPPAS